MNCTVPTGKANAVFGDARNQAASYLICAHSLWSVIFKPAAYLICAVVSLAVSFLSQCFTCSTCRNRLVPGDRFHYINGSLFCEHDRPTALINGHLNSLQSNPLLPDQKVNTPQLLISFIRAKWRSIYFRFNSGRFPTPAVRPLSNRT